MVYYIYAINPIYVNQKGVLVATTKRIVKKQNREDLTKHETRRSTPTRKTVAQQQAFIEKNIAKGLSCDIRANAVDYGRSRKRGESRVGRIPRDTPLGFEKDLVLNCIERCKGNFLAISNVFEVCPSTVYTWAQKWPWFLEATQKARELRVDTAEIKLDDKLHQGDITAIIFTLKTLGQNRGYIEKQKLEALLGGNATFTLTGLSDAVNNGKADTYSAEDIA